MNLRNECSSAGILNSPPEEGCPQGGVVDSRNTSNYFSLPYNPKLKEKVKALRKAENLSEVLLWQQIKNCQFKNLDFDRQKIIGNYIVDFYCASLGLIIEVDGYTHDSKAECDAARELFLKKLGLRIIHLDDRELKNNLDGVMTWLNQHEMFEALNQPPRHATHATPPLEGNYHIPSAPTL